MTSGTVAFRDGRMAGYLFGSIVLPNPTSTLALFAAPRSVLIGDAGYASVADGAAEIYRELYAAAAPVWVRSGCFSHRVPVRFCDAAALDGWRSLGFARQMVSGVHDLTPLRLAAAPSEVEIARAGPEDAETVMQLFRANLRYHARPPIFDAYLKEAEGELRNDVEQLFAEPETTPVWLAQRGTRAVGLVSLVPPRPRTTTPDGAVHLQQGYTEPDARGGGVATALLAEAFAWARAAGYRRCTINWHTANLLGARFWQRSGFRPVVYSLVRQIDERIAWVGQG